MINMSDLSKIENDATEDRQKLFAQFARNDNDGLFGPLQRLQQNQVQYSIQKQFQQNVFMNHQQN